MRESFYWEYFGKGYCKTGVDPWRKMCIRYGSGTPSPRREM